MNIQKFDLQDFLPDSIYGGTGKNKFPLQIKEQSGELILSYYTPNYNGGTREYSEYLHRYINKNNETFEVLGLLQAEMGKTQNGCINFCNHEYQIMKKVMGWFEKEIGILCKWWKWYIKVNINEPENTDYKKEVESKVINYWLSKTKIDRKMNYPKAVSYVKNTENKKLGDSDYGTLIIEDKNNLLSQVVKKFVKDVTYNITSYENEEIRRFMRGIIAGEGCVEIDLPSKKFRVRVTAIKEEERKIFWKSLSIIGISSIDYEKNQSIIISKKHNLLELLQQKLLSLSPQKYNKFLRIFQLYDDFPEYETWKQQQTKPHNRIPQEIIDRILELHYQMPTAPAWKIAEEVGVSAIKVQRVLKEQNLGKRQPKTIESKRKEIAQFATENQNLTQKQMAEQLQVHESVVRRACKKYNPSSALEKHE